MYYIIFSMVIFAAGGLTFYWLVRLTIIRQIDQSMMTEAEIIQEQILFYDSIPDFNNIFGYQISVNVYEKSVYPGQKIQDTVITDPETTLSSGYRHLVLYGNMEDKKGYRISIYKSIEDTHNLITDMFLITSLAFILLSIILVVVNYWISRRIWVPFYHTLEKIKDFNINDKLELNLSPSGIREFDSLNRVLNTMSEKIRADYLNLKEFTEDASHEIQTPLSIIKSKLELLFQSENLTDKQAENIRAIYEATTRLSKLNYSLLLISRIQNLQYAYKEKVHLVAITDKFLAHFKEVIDQKNIRVDKNYAAPVHKLMNPDLSEVLISNLLGNAFKHNIQDGWVSIDLDNSSLIIRNTGNKITSNPNDLFKRFKKGDVSGDSSGLGLSIVSKIAALYNMDIDYSLDGNIHCLKVDFNIS